MQKQEKSLQKVFCIFIYKYININSLKIKANPQDFKCDNTIARPVTTLSTKVENTEVYNMFTVHQ